MTSVGKAIPHESATGHVSGEALYTDDLVGRYANPLHAWPVLSPHAHATVLSIDGGKAALVPGFVKLLTADDVPGHNEVGAVQHDEPLFPSEVQFHNQPVAWVLADTLDAAREAAAAVVVEYTPLPAIVTMEQALEANSFLTDPLTIISGDPAQALAAA